MGDGAGLPAPSPLFLRHTEVMSSTHIDPAGFATAKRLLAERGIRPRRRWGQNFLCNRQTLERIADAAEIDPSDHVLEIGPGLGGLTQSLAKRARHVTAVEIDPEMVTILRKTLAGIDHVQIVQGDFLQVFDGELAEKTFGDVPGVVAANVPYYITSPIIDRLLQHRDRIRTIVLLTQTEFAERMAAPVGSDKGGLLSVGVQLAARVETLFTVPPAQFLPSPDVTSTVVRLQILDPPPIPAECAAEVYAVAKALYAQRRKTASNTLAAGGFCSHKEDARALLERAGVNPDARGETFTLQQLLRIAAAMPDSACSTHNG